jgi:hypothetical protein
VSMKGHSRDPLAQECTPQTVTNIPLRTKQFHHSNAFSELPGVNMKPIWWTLAFITLVFGCIFWMVWESAKTEALLIQVEGER